MCFAICTLPLILQALSKALEAATCGLQGIAITIFSASCRWPAQPRRSTMCRCNVPILQESYSLWALKHISTCLPPDLYGYKKTNKVISSGYTSFSHIHSKSLRASLACSCTHLSSSSATMLTHAFSTATKVTESSHTPSCCICQNSSSAFCPCLHFISPN